MTVAESSSAVPPVARLAGISLSYGKTLALDNISLDFPASCMVGLIGPDGVGKSSLLALLAGARAVQQGHLEALGGDMSSKRHRDTVCPRIAYMPQGLGKNLYPTLSVEENLQFFGRLFGHNAAERRQRIDELTTRTGLHPFLSRPAGKLSGGMKQKLALCCALIHKPRVLFLDEPTTGVDPVSRKEFWEMLKSLKAQDITIMVSTPYMDEASLCDRIALIQSGKIMSVDTPNNIVDHYPYKLYQTKAANNYHLLEHLKQQGNVHRCYISGEFLHVVFKDNATCIHYPYTDLREIKPSIEDCFINLMDNEL